jgi:hypothetical protein
MESVHIDFIQGISAVMDPKLIGGGFAVFLENVDLSGVSAKSIRAPAFIRDIPAGTKDLFEYRGKWHFTTGRREWEAEYVGRQERLYYKDVEPGTADRRPYKMIDNVSAVLGTIRPKTAPLISDASSAMIANLGISTVENTGSLSAGGTSYRVGVRTSFGLLPTTSPVSVTVKDKMSTVLTWAKVTGSATAKAAWDDAISIVIYGRTSGAEQIIEEIETTSLEYIDNGSRYPAGQYAKTLDETTLFYYFYTLVRNTNGHPNESGPSPTYGPVETNQVRKITRNPIFEGLFDGSTLFVAGELSTTATVQDDVIVGKAKRISSGKTYITTDTAHSRTTGDQVGIINLHGGTDLAVRSQIYGVTVPTAVLPKPAITSFADSDGNDDGWTEGTVLNVSVAAYRGAGWDACYGGRPAETAIAVGDTETLTVGAAVGGHNLRAKVKWSFSSSDHDGFHVYLDGGYIATVSKDLLFYEFGTVTPDMSRVPPAADTTRTRVFSLPVTAGGIAWDEDLADDATWGAVAYDPFTKVTLTDPTRYTPIEGDLIYFTPNLPEIPGYHRVDMDEDKHGAITTGDFYVRAITEANHTLTGSQQCKAAGPNARFVTEWNLYVARNDTGSFLLQGAYPIDQTDVVDYKPVEALGSTCGSDYFTTGANGESINVVFEPPPSDIHGLTLHNNSLWGIVDRTVRWTPINRPDAWPDAYTRDFASEPWALKSYAGTMLVLCADGVYRMDGTDPSGMQCHKTLSEDGIIAPYSIQATAAGLIFLTREGLVAYRAELNNTVPISKDKMDASVLLSASGVPEDGPFPFWAIPSRHGAFWAKLTKDLPAADPNRLERTMSDDLPLTWPLMNIRSFYHKGKYHLYYGVGETP